MIDYEEHCIFALIFRHRGSIIYRALFFALPATLLTLGLLSLEDVFPEFRETFTLAGGSTLWSAGSAALIFIIGFRTNRAIVRFWEGTGLLHQMRGEWFDTVSNCVSFSIKSSRDQSKVKKVLEFRHTLIRLMSLVHGYALEEISGNQFEMTTIDVHGLDRGTRRYLKEGCEDCGFNKVEMTLHLVQSLIVSAFHDGVLDIPAPILSRVFQTLSRGFVHLLNTKKITDTKFPFPYAQLIAILMFAATFLLPLLLASIIPNKLVAAVLTFLPIFAMAALNYIAMEIENPFGRDDNDLAMDHFQKEMDSCLLMLLHPFSDTVPHPGHLCEYNFMTLFDTYGPNASRDHEDEYGMLERETKLKRWDSTVLATLSRKSEAHLQMETNEQTQNFAVVRDPEVKDHVVGAIVEDGSGGKSSEMDFVFSSRSRVCESGSEYPRDGKGFRKVCTPFASEDSEPLAAHLGDDIFAHRCVMYLQIDTIGNTEFDQARISRSHQSSGMRHQKSSSSASSQPCNVHLRIEGLEGLSLKGIGSRDSVSSEVPIHGTIEPPLRLPVSTPRPKKSKGWRPKTPPRAGERLLRN